MNSRNQSFFKSEFLLMALVTSPVWLHAGGPRQTQAESSSAGQAVKTGPSVAPRNDLTIEKGEPVSLLLLETISSKHLKVGDRVHFRVTDPVIIDHLVVVPRKAAAWGTVTAFRPRGRRLRSADVSITVNEVDLINGKPASLGAVWEDGGHLSSEHRDDVALGVVQTYFIGLAFVPLMHGDEVVITKGTEFSATFAEPIALDRAEIERLQPPPITARRARLLLSTSTSAHSRYLTPFGAGR